MKSTNTKQLTISATPQTKVGMNFQKLMEKSMYAIQKISGNNGSWTNYNASDPGITILELLCYAITDLGYRLSFPMADLLAADPNNPKTKNSESILIQARKIFNVTPVTINDYRKMLIDIEGVNNAWLEVISDELVFNKSLLFAVQGFYKVIIEPEKYIFDQGQEDALLNKIRNTLEQRRNLSEDFAQVEILIPAIMEFKVEIEVVDDINTATLTQDIWNNIEHEIMPKIPTYSLNTLVNQGKTIEDIFDGPALKHGFILDKDLKPSTPTREIHLNDIRTAISNITGVISVPKIDAKELSLKVNSQNLGNDIITFGHNVALFLKEIEVSFFKNDVCYEIRRLADSCAFCSDKSVKDTALPIPKGNYRNLKDYTSIQEDFPNNYCVSNDSSSDNILSTDHAAVVKQLRAYLLFFDQTLANNFAQLDGFKSLFNYVDDIGLPDMKTYMSGVIEDSDIKPIVSNDYAERIKLISDPTIGNPVDSNIRKGLILDYLLAIYGEQFISYSCLFNKNPDNTIDTDSLKDPTSIETVDKKIRYLRKYPKANGSRFLGIDYFDIGKKNWLLERIATYLDLEEKEELFVIEHILLTPRDNSNIDPELINEFGDIYSYQISIVIPVKFFNNLKSGIVLALDTAVPAHLKANYYWLRSGDERDFLQLYHDWCIARKNFINNPETNVKNLDLASNALARFLLDIDTRKENNDGGIGNMVIEGEDIIKDGALSRFVVG